MVLFAGVTGCFPRLRPDTLVGLRTCGANPTYTERSGFKDRNKLYVSGVNMIPIYSPKSESEAAVIASLMQAYGISFLMRGAAFSSMYPGPVSNSLNAQTLMVEAVDVQLATLLIQPFVD